MKKRNRNEENPSFLRDKEVISILFPGKMHATGSIFRNRYKTFTGSIMKMQIFNHKAT
jgi:hypothetical protein